ncbi:Ldh family oxidoreductase [Meiothermus taiwanensis]|uniref:(2R)-3-sulfolactate dehydrogenase (NADP(+)) n=2 Tax=Meiothermus taiwanensis TaxID=172827 RepID=A0A399DXK2_9DEIN|nr:Ldh family oxidoreductase [Meiothermus taiwanensis]AWR87307.1 Malate/L-lactate dehydrogenase [Meiothermus taiwanensis WR-220]KIQ54736.1 lactate dehydrogenase [Meiothermus taiwanensis]KZK15290.1 lactate dehydrogenase [Meiothermus taiwanensis]RIH76103.1 (2R)-3-sulfolactate dehydrogenase (NADP(+)) [Meiothermus taiwanensis]
MRVPYPTLKQALSSHFQGLGLAPDQAEAFAEVILEAELEGNVGHGLTRVAQYTAQLRAGGLNPRPQMRLERTKPGVAVLHADGAPGPVAGLFAVQALAPMAREQGSAALAVRGAGHSGVLSAYVGRLARQGLVALAFANTPPAIAPGPVLGTNPIALGAPAEPQPIIIDTSISVVARGKIIAAAKKGEPIPPGWALDKEGRPTTDAQAALEGSLLPIGEGKGFALAVLVEVLAGALAGEVLSPELPLPWMPPEQAAKPGLLLLAFDPAAFGTGYGGRLAQLVQALEAAGGRIPGARRAALREKSLVEGVEVNETLEAELGKLGVHLQGGGTR